MAAAYDGLSGAMILAPIGTVTHASRRTRNLADRDLSRQSSTQGAHGFTGTTTSSAYRCTSSMHPSSDDSATRHLDRRL